MELTLLRGKPTFVEGIGNIYSLTLGEIQELGDEKFALFIQLITFSVDWFEQSKLNKEIAELMCWALSLVTKDSVFFNGQFFVVADGVISPENYMRFVEVINKQYGFKQQQEEDYANEKARQIAEKIKAQKAKIKQPKNEISLGDIISAVCAKHPSINLFNVWDMTLYQLYDQFSRLNVIENYSNTIYLLPHGGDSSDLKHWSTKIKEDD